MKESREPEFEFLPVETADLFDAHPVRTSEQDRFASFCNTLKGYEEFILNTDGVIIGSNLESVNVTGYEEWEVIGRHFSIFYPATDVDAGQPQQDLQNAIDFGKVLYSSNRVRKKGIVFLAKVRITVLKNEIGAFTGFRMTLKDASHNVLYNYRVKRVRDEYLNLFNNSFIGIFKFRLNDGKILLLNDKAKELLSVSDDDDLSFVHIFSDAATFDMFRSRLCESDGRNIEEQLEYKGLWLSISCRSFLRQGFVEGVLIDITEKKKQVAELQRLNQEIDKFIYHSSHDMRSPLTTIMGLTHLISLDHPSPSIQQYNSMIRSQVAHLDHLLKSLVNITFNKSEPVNELIDFEKELEIILREFRHQYQQVRVHSYFEGSNQFCSDPARIHIILKNLISNAFRFHNPQAEHPYVNIKIVETREQATIIVSDNGIGIDERCVDNIFTMFYKAERGSTGLGLYIVKSMVDKLGGSIKVRSKPGEGSTFTVRLPA